MDAREQLAHDLFACDRDIEVAKTAHIQTSDERAFSIALEQFKAARIAAYEAYDMEVYGAEAAGLVGRKGH